MKSATYQEDQDQASAAKLKAPAMYRVTCRAGREFKCIRGPGHQTFPAGRLNGSERLADTRLVICKFSSSLSARRKRESGTSYRYQKIHSGNLPMTTPCL